MWQEEERFQSRGICCHHPLPIMPLGGKTLPFWLNIWVFVY